MFEKVYPKTLRIDVIQEDIAKGRRGQAYRCPVALAIKRMFPDESVSVTGATIVIDRAVYYSDASRKFVANFDYGDEVKPQIIVFERDYEAD